MNESRYTIMKKLIIIIGIIAAILAFLIPFKAKSQLHVIGRVLNFKAAISMSSAARIVSVGEREITFWQAK
jgi:hypothetical protein